MAAGLGFKDFQTGEVLTAADVDGYLMQGIWVFASAAARDAAVTSPQEGNFAFLKDTNTTTYYTGSAWTNLDTTGMVNPMTTTGDTIYSSSGSTPARLGIGTAGQVLQVNSGATAPEWATPASGGGLTLISNTVLSSQSSLDLTSIPGTYKHLRLDWQGVYHTSTGNVFGIRLNADTGSNYYFGSSYINNNSVSQSDDVGNYLGRDEGQPFGNNATFTALDRVVNGSLILFDYASTSLLKKFQLDVHFYNNTYSTNVMSHYEGIYDSTSAITQINVVRVAGTGNMSNVTNTSVRLWGQS